VIASPASLVILVAGVGAGDPAHTVCDTLRLDVATEHPAGSFTRCVAVADLDLDGDADVAASERDGETIFVHLNDGTGALVLDRTIEATGGVQNRVIAAKDLDDDGLPDLAVVNRQVTVFLNLGHDGGGAWLGFGPPTTYAAFWSPHWVEAADVDGDLVPDLVVANLGISIANNTLSIFPGAGGGTFAPRMDFPVGFSSKPLSAAPADLDGDGDLDVAVVDGRQDGPAIHVFPNLGRDGGAWLGFGPPVVVPVQLGPRAVEAGDLDCDGDLDLVVAHRTREIVSLLRNAGGLVFQVEEIAVGIGGEHARPVDLDADGHLDVAVVLRDLHRVDVLLNDGTGALVNVGAVAAGTEPKFVDVGDLDGNGRVDLVVANSYPGAPGTFSVHRNETTADARTCPGDVACDGATDVGDLLAVLGAWGSVAGPPLDLDGSGAVDVGDLLGVLAGWGACSPTPPGCGP
jgi:hypothetical protein